MKCAICGISVTRKPLQRVNSKDENGIWWCWDCLKRHEPELYKNEKEDQSDVEKILINEIYKNKTK